MNMRLKKSNSGFTLIELMTVIAIIGILASAIMISLGVQKKRATVNKVLTELSGVMENIYLCKSDDGTVDAPAGGGGGNICTIGPNDASYGIWPKIDSDKFTYVSSTTAEFANSKWFYQAKPDDPTMETICCNSKSGKCGKLDPGVPCDVNTDIK